MAPALTVVFVNYNSTRELAGALASLPEACRGLEFEVVVADNRSGDPEALKQTCRRYGARLMLLPRNLGYGAAANRGFRRAAGRYVAVANPDLVFTPGAVKSLVGFLEEHPEAGVVGPQLLYPDGTPQPSARRFPRLRYVLAGRRSPLLRLFPRYSLSREFLYQDADREELPVPVEAVIGTFMVFRRTALDVVRGFDERFFMFAEDMDICRRLHEGGWQVYLDPRVRIEHYYGGVRRRYRRFSEYQRLKALCQFLCLGRNAVSRTLLAFACACYLVAVEAGLLLGLGEYEHSWYHGDTSS